MFRLNSYFSLWFSRQAKGVNGSCLTSFASCIQFVMRIYLDSVCKFWPMESLTQVCLDYAFQSMNYSDWTLHHEFVVSCTVDISNYFSWTLLIRHMLQWSLHHSRKLVRKSGMDQAFICNLSLSNLLKCKWLRYLRGRSAGFEASLHILQSKKSLRTIQKVRWQQQVSECL